MLCIIFTKKKILAGIQTTPTSLIEFGLKKYLRYDSPLLAAFQHHYPPLMNAYKCFLKKNNKDTNGPVPVAVILPVNASPRERKALIEWIKSQHDFFHLAFIGNLQQAYLKSLQDEKELANTNCLVIDALDDHLMLSYHLTSPSALAIPPVLLPKLGSKAGKDHIVETIITDLARQGLILGEDHAQHLFEQIAQDNSLEDFKIHKKNDALNLQVTYHLAAAKQKELLVLQHHLLDFYLNKDTLSHKNIFKIILIGEYFDNEIILNYLCDTLDIRNKIFAPDIQNEEKVFLRILKNTFDQTLKTQSTLAAARQQLNKGIKIPLLEKKETQAKAFISEGSTSGILATKHITTQSSSTLSNVTVRSHSPISEIDALSRKENNYKQLDLERYFQIEDLYSNRQYLSFRGKLNASPDYKVFRFISKDQAKKPKLLKQFRELYKNEVSYYENLSTIANNQIGHYYFRSFIPGDTLGQYFKNNNLIKKNNINQLSNKDLKLILQVWEEINGLKFACKHMQEGNILVQSRLKWNLTHEIKIKLVGFNSATCSKWEMIEDVHTIFERLLGQKLYSEFRNKFKL